MARNKRDQDIVNMVNALLQKGNVKNAEDLQDAFKQLMGSDIETML